jgi:protein transport protein SEC61 subunit beta
MTSGPESGPDSTPSAQKASGSSSIARAGSPPGGPRSAIRRRAAADHKESVKNARPTSTRSAGAGGSSGTMLRLYTDESPGLRVDPMVIMFLSLGFIFSVVALHCGWSEAWHEMVANTRHSDCEGYETLLVRGMFAWGLGTYRCKRCRGE